MHHLCCTSHSLQKLKAEKKISDNVLSHTLTRNGVFPAGISEGLCLHGRRLVHGTPAAPSGTFFRGHLVLGNISCAPAFWEEMGRQRCVALQRAHPSLLHPSRASAEQRIKPAPQVFITLPLITAFGGLAGRGLHSQKGTCWSAWASTRWLLTIPNTFKTSQSIAACGSACTRTLLWVSLLLVYLTPAHTLPFSLQHPSGF